MKRKIIGISQEMTEEEYKSVCSRLGGTKLEHTEDIQAKGKTEEEREKALELLKGVDHPEIITFEKSTSEDEDITCVSSSFNPSHNEESVSETTSLVT